MFVPVMGKMIIALIWAFWMLSVDSTLGQEKLPKKVKNVWVEKTLPEYFPTYGSTVKRVREEGSVRCGTKLDFAGFSERYWDDDSGSI